MALTTKKDFAAKVGMTTKELAVYKRRRKVEYEENGLVDDTKAVNKAFLIEYSGKAEVKEYKKANAGAMAGKVPLKGVALPEGMDADDVALEQPVLPVNNRFTEADQQYSEERARRTRLLADLKQMEIDRAMGLLIDYASVKTLISEFSRNLNTEVKNAVESILSLVGSMYGLSNKQSADLRREAFARINLANETAISETKKGLQVITDETLGKVA